MTKRRVYGRIIGTIWRTDAPKKKCVRGGKMNISQDAKLKIRLIYGIVTSVMLAILGVCFITACYGIYISGDNPFTRESVGEALMSIIVPIIISIVLIIGGFVLHLVFPTEKAAVKPLVTDEVAEARLLAARDMDGDASIRSAIEREINLRSALKLINVIVVCAAAVVIGLYVFNPANYTDDLNKSVINLTISVTIPLLPALLLAAARLIVEPISYKREIELLKLLPRADKSAPAAEKITAISKIALFFKKNERPITLGVRIAVLLAGVVYVILGISNGGMGDVLAKAIKICTECIGLG